jgi:hypothetical protein
MQRLGLLEADGWRIAEFIRECAGGSELVLRPLHLRLAPPEGLECVVRIEEETLSLDTQCSPALSGRPG